MPPSDTFEDEDITIAETTTVRRRSGKAGDSDLVTTSLALSPRVIDHFKATGDDWQSRVNEALNIIVNRTHAREAKKRARLRARSAVRRRQPASGD